MHTFSHVAILILAAACFLIDIFPHKLPIKFTAAGLLCLTVWFIQRAL